MKTRIQVGGTHSTVWLEDLPLNQQAKITSTIKALPSEAQAGVFWELMRGNTVPFEYMTDGGDLPSFKYELRLRVVEG